MSSILPQAKHNVFYFFERKTVLKHAQDQCCVFIIQNSAYHGREWAPTLRWRRGKQDLFQAERVTTGPLLNTRKLDGKQLL